MGGLRYIKKGGARAGSEICYRDICRFVKERRMRFSYLTTENHGNGWGVAVTSSVICPATGLKR